MFLLNLIRYLRGYVWFEARGAFVERFLNLVARDQISVWSGNKRGERYTACVAAKDYRRLRKHAKKTGVHLRVAKKQGVPFQRRKYRKRTGLLIGLGIFFAFLYSMSLFIWQIEIGGSEELDDLAVLQALEALEIRPGTLRRSIDVRDCERKLLLLLPELSWAALNIDGSSLRVELSESVQPPVMIDPKAPCNIIAGEAGQITALYVFEGQALVAVGDTVLPGDIIVSGITQDGREQSLFRHARAQVYAETTQVFEIDVPLEQIEYVETGKTVRRRYFGIFGIDLPAFLPFKISAPYHVDRSESQLSVFSVPLPLRLQREEYILMEAVPKKLSQDEAEAEALRELENLMTTHLAEAEILEQTLDGEMQADRFSLRAEIFCKMDIAAEQAILTDATPDDTQ